MFVRMISEVSIDGKLTFGKNISSKEMFSRISKEDLNNIYNYRTEAQAIIVGKNTVDIDNPYLTDRIGGKKLLRIIPSNSLDFNYSSNVFTDGNETLVVTCQENMKTNRLRQLDIYGIRYLICGKDEVDFIGLFGYLQNIGIKTVIIEGGGYLNQKMIEANIVDEIILFQLPIIVGGESTPSLVDGPVSVLREYEFVDSNQYNSYLQIRFKKKRSVDNDKSFGD